MWTAVIEVELDFGSRKILTMRALLVDTWASGSAFGFRCTNQLYYYCVLGIRATGGVGGCDVAMTWLGVGVAGPTVDLGD